MRVQLGVTGAGVEVVIGDRRDPGDTDLGHRAVAVSNARPSCGHLPLEEGDPRLGQWLDQRRGYFFTGMFPITEAIHVGGFAMIDVDDYSKLNGLNWTVGSGVRLLLDSAED